MTIASSIYARDAEITALSSSFEDESVVLVGARQVVNGSIQNTLSLVSIDLPDNDDASTNVARGVRTLTQIPLSTKTRNSTSSAFGMYNGEDVLCSDGHQLTTYHSSQGLQPSHKIRFASFNPHTPRSINILHGDSILHHDTRTATFESVLEWKGLLSMDVNPIQSFQFCIGDRDGLVVFFDTRMSLQPIKTLAHSNTDSSPVVDSGNCASRELQRISEHSFWAGCVRYNPFHDQLVLSGGCDGIVNLHSCVGISSRNVRPVSASSLSPVDTSNDVLDASDDDDDEGEFGRPEEGLVKSYDLHEDSVNSVCWSVSDPWVFASLSADGNIIMNKVPTLHKYKIML